MNIDTFVMWGIYSYSISKNYHEHDELAYVQQGFWKDGQLSGYGKYENNVGYKAVGEYVEGRLEGRAYQDAWGETHFGNFKGSSFYGENRKMKDSKIFI